MRPIPESSPPARFIPGGVASIAAGAVLAAAATYGWLRTRSARQT
jgi:hypothetical protein